MRKINLRAHHLLCIPRYYRGGYDHKFAKNMKKICLEIRRNPEVKINLGAKCDDLCHKCPYEHKGVCAQTPKIGGDVLSWDKKVLKALKLKENSVHKARDILGLAIDKFDRSDIRKVCDNCIFFDSCIKVGINNSFRKEVLKGSK